MSEKPYTTQPLSIPEREEERDFTRADLRFFGLDHSGPSYQARVFLNNPTANETTPREQESGYAGAFTIFGHGGCFGEAGHCDLPPGPREPFDLRPPHPLTPTTKTVIVTDSLRQLRDDGAREFTVTIVPIAYQTNLPTGRPRNGPVLQFDSISLLTYQ